MVDLGILDGLFCLALVVVRFATLIPAGLLANSISLYMDVRKLEVLSMIPQGSRFLQGLEIGGTMGIVGCVWNFLVLIPSLQVAGLVQTIIGLVDLAIAVPLLFAVVYQLEYLPRSRSDCLYAATWRDATGESNFFQVVGNQNSPTTTPQVVCQQYYYSWALAVALTVLYLIFAASNILLGGFCSPESSISQNKAIKWWIYPDPLKYIVLYTTSGIRYRLRYCSKLRQRTKLETVSELRMLPSNHRDEKSIALASESKPERQHQQDGSFLSYDLLMLIVRELHYVDVINFSLASRSLRDALLPRADTAARTRALRIYTCEGSKSECSICGNQICPSCTKKGKRFNTARTCHLQSCKAQCSECYYSKVCLPGKSKHSHSCCLASKKHNRGGCGVASLKLCQICVKMSVVEIELRCDARDRFLIRRSAGKTVACSECGAELQNNRPLWWVCSKCSRECQDHIHPPWIERTDV